MPSAFRLASASLVRELMKSRSIHSWSVSSTCSVLHAKRETSQSPTSQPATPLAAKLIPFC
jgi:hypothetical protein